MTDAVSEPLEPTPAAPAKRSLRPWLLVGGGVLIVLVVAVIVIVNMNAKSPFESAVEECGLESSNGVRVGDDGNTLIIDGAGKDGEGAQMAETACVVHVLDVPDSTVALIEGTRALDGTQSDEFNDVKVQWSYHPDSGLDLIFSR